MQQATTQTIGMDVSDKKSRICVLSPAGEIVEERWINTTRHGVQRYFEKQPRSRVVLEAGTHALWMTWQIEELGHEVIVANPRNLGLIYKSRKKSDPQDAHRLAQLGRVDPALLSPVTLRGRDTQWHLAQIRSRPPHGRRGDAETQGGRRIARDRGEIFAPLRLCESPH